MWSSIESDGIGLAPETITSANNTSSTQYHPLGPESREYDAFLKKLANLRANYTRWKGEHAARPPRLEKEVDEILSMPLDGQTNETVKLPNNYTLIRKTSPEAPGKTQKSSSSILLYGHPSSDKRDDQGAFLSFKDFAPHYVWLLRVTDKVTRDYAECTCRLCPKYIDRIALLHDTILKPVKESKRYEFRRPFFRKHEFVWVPVYYNGGKQVQNGSLKAKTLLESRPRGERSEVENQLFYWPAVVWKVSAKSDSQANAHDKVVQEWRISYKVQLIRDESVYDYDQSLIYPYLAFEMPADFKRNRLLPRSIVNSIIRGNFEAAIKTTERHAFRISPFGNYNPRPPQPKTSDTREDIRYCNQVYQNDFYRGIYFGSEVIRLGDCVRIAGMGDRQTDEVDIVIVERIFMVAQGGSQKVKIIGRPYRWRTRFSATLDENNNDSSKDRIPYNTVMTAVVPLSKKSLIGGIIFDVDEIVGRYYPIRTRLVKCLSERSFNSWLDLDEAHLVSRYPQLFKLGNYAEDYFREFPRDSEPKPCGIDQGNLSFFGIRSDDQPEFDDRLVVDHIADLTRSSGRGQLRPIRRRKRSENVGRPARFTFQSDRSITPEENTHKRPADILTKSQSVPSPAFHTKLVEKAKKKKPSAARKIPLFFEDETDEAESSDDEDLPLATRRGTPLSSGNRTPKNYIPCGYPLCFSDKSATKVDAKHGSVCDVCYKLIKKKTAERTEALSTRKKDRKRLKELKKLRAMKRPPPSYVRYSMYMNKTYPKIASMDFTKRAKLLASKWANMSESQKRPHVTAALQGLMKYKEEKKRLKILEGKLSKKRSTKRKHSDKQKSVKSVDKDKPKMPISMFFTFFHERRDEYYAKFGTVDGLAQKEIGKAWKKLPEEEKMVYKERYRKEKEIYDKKMLEYYASKSIKKTKKDLPVVVDTIVDDMIFDDAIVDDTIVDDPDSENFAGEMKFTCPHSDCVASFSRKDHYEMHSQLFHDGEVLSDINYSDEDIKPIVRNPSAFEFDVIVEEDDDDEMDNVSSSDYADDGDESEEEDSSDDSDENAYDDSGESGSEEDTDENISDAFELESDEDSLPVTDEEEEEPRVVQRKTSVTANVPKEKASSRLLREFEIEFRDLLGDSTEPLDSVQLIQEYNGPKNPIQFSKEPRSRTDSRRSSNSFQGGLESIDLSDMAKVQVNTLMAVPFDKFPPLVLEKITKGLQELFKAVWKNGNSYFFRSPVDPIRDLLPDYLDRITNPKDLKYIGYRLQIPKIKYDTKPPAYTDMVEFAKDFCQMFSNCFAYFEPTHARFKDGERLFKFWRRNFFTFLEDLLENDVPNPEALDDDNTVAVVAAESTGKTQLQVDVADIGIVKDDIEMVESPQLLSPASFGENEVPLKGVPESPQPMQDIFAEEQDESTNNEVTMPDIQDGNTNNEVTVQDIVGDVSGDVGCFEMVPCETFAAIKGINDLRINIELPKLDLISDLARSNSVGSGNVLKKNNGEKGDAPVVEGSIITPGAIHMENGQVYSPLDPLEADISYIPPPDVVPEEILSGTSGHFSSEYGLWENPSSSSLDYSFDFRQSEQPPESVNGGLINDSLGFEESNYPYEPRVEPLQPEVAEHICLHWNEDGNPFESAVKFVDVEFVGKSQDVSFVPLPESFRPYHDILRIQALGTKGYFDCSVLGSQEQVEDVLSRNLIRFEDDESEQEFITKFENSAGNTTTGMDIDYNSMSEDDQVLFLVRLKKVPGDDDAFKYFKSFLEQKVLYCENSVMCGLIWLMAKKVVLVGTRRGKSKLQALFPFLEKVV